MDVQDPAEVERGLLHLRPCRQIISFLFTLTLLSPALAWPLLAVEWQEGSLSVIAEEAPLAKLLQEVARQTGVEVQGLEGLRAEVSVRFSGLPLEAGLRKLLAPVNYLLVEKVSPQEGTRPTLALVFTRGTPLAANPNKDGTPPGNESAVGEDRKERFAALHAAAELGNKSLLREAVFDPDPSLQEAALALLAEQDRQEAADLLVEAAQSAHPQQRLQALQLLHHSGQVDEQTVLTALDIAIADVDAEVKGYAIQALVERGRPESIGQLDRALRDPDPSVRLLVLESVVSAVPQEQRHSFLQEASGDADAQVRAAAAAWLGQAVDEEPAL